MNEPHILDFNLNSVSISGAEFVSDFDSSFVDFELNNPIDDLISPTWEDINLVFTDFDAGA